MAVLFADHTRLSWLVLVQSKLAEARPVRQFDHLLHDRFSLRITWDQNAHRSSEDDVKPVRLVSKVQYVGTNWLVLIFYM